MFQLHVTCKDCKVIRYDQWHAPATNSYSFYLLNHGKLDLLEFDLFPPYVAVGKLDVLCKVCDVTENTN